MLNQAIIKSALLGLKSHKIDKSIFHPKVQEYLRDTKDETMFLNGLSLSFQYFESGKELPVIEKLSSLVETCPSEGKALVDNYWIRALEIISRDEYFAFNYYSFMRILSEKTLEQNKILPADKLIKVLMLLQNVKSYEKRRVGFKASYKTFANRKLYPSFDEVRSLIVASFGVSGRWIFEMIDGKGEIELEELNAKDRLTTFEKYWLYEKEKVPGFLDSFYAHETPANQKKILVIIGQTLTDDDANIYNFFERFFKEKKGKRIDTLSQYFETLKLMVDSQLTKNQLVESIFVKLWAKKGFLKKSFILLPKDELEPILEPLDELKIAALVDDDGLQGIDLKLFFLFQLVPIERASQLLGINPNKYIKAISEVKSFENNKSFRPLRALLRNVLKTNNKIFAKAILSQSNRTNGSYVELLLLFSDQEIYNLLEKDFSILDNSELDVFEILVKELNCQETWPKKLTRLMLNRLLTHQHFYSYTNRRNQALWLGGPFYHKDVIQIVDQLINLDEHKGAWKTDEIQLTIKNINIAKSAFNDALNQ